MRAKLTNACRNVKDALELTFCHAAARAGISVIGETARARQGKPTARDVAATMHGTVQRLVTRNGPRIHPSSKKWIVEMYIWTCWLRPRLPDSQERGRTTHWVYRGDGGGRWPPRARTRRLARHLCRQHRSESDIFLSNFSGLILHRKSNGNQYQPGKKWPACGQSQGMGPNHPGNG